MSIHIVSATPLRLASISLALCLSGVPIALLIGFTARLLGYQVDFLAYLVFVALEVAALCVGIAGRQQPPARWSVFASGALLLISVLFI